MLLNAHSGALGFLNCTYCGLIPATKPAQIARMPRPRQPDRKKPPRVAVRKEFVPIAEELARREAKEFTQVVNDALRFYFERAYDPPLWPPLSLQQQNRDAGSE